MKDSSLDAKQGILLKNSGMQQAIENADYTHENWGSDAYNFLLKYCKKHKSFLAEDVRVASNGIIPEPPSKRAWGYVITMAKKNKIIKRLGYATVKNPKAHGATATLWASLTYKLI